MTGRTIRGKTEQQGWKRGAGEGKEAGGNAWRAAPPTKELQTALMVLVRGVPEERPELLHSDRAACPCCQEMWAQESGERRWVHRPSV